jgi:hypothetical protein
MALTEFVRNVQDLSDDGGYKFRFHCDRCSDGVESQYIRSSANVLKTGVQVFQIFRNFGWGSTAVEGLDRGLRGREHDAAYERAVNEAMVHFSKCSRCGLRVCAHCWNPEAGLCEGCAPAAYEQAAAVAAQLRVDRMVAGVRQGEPAPGLSTCPVCARPSGGGRFCQSCGADTAPARYCTGCGQALAPTAAFCGQCGTAAQ